MEKEEIIKRKQELKKEESKLNKQLKELESVERQEKINKNKIRMNNLREHKAFLISLFEHDYPNCNDENLSNGFDGGTEQRERNEWRCDKCAMIDMLNDEDWDKNFEIKFNIEITKL